MKLPLFAFVALSAAPVGACAYDFMPGFMGHGYLPAMSAAEAEAAREAAIKRARQSFIARHNLASEDTVASEDGQSAQKGDAVAQAFSGSSPSDADNSSAEPRDIP